MAFNIDFYRNNSESNRLDKDIDLIITATGTLKEGSSIIKPNVLVDSIIDNIIGSNYVYISEFNRYYFIEDIISEYNSLLRVILRVDVLMSFKNDILLNRAIIQKSERNWNLYLNDGIMRTYQYKNIETIKFPTAFPTGTDLVMAVAGKSNIE